MKMDEEERWFSLTEERLSGGRSLVLLIVVRVIVPTCGCAKIRNHIRSGEKQLKSLQHSIPGKSLNFRKQLASARQTACQPQFQSLAVAAFDRMLAPRLWLPILQSPRRAPTQNIYPSLLLPCLCCFHLEFDRYCNHLMKPSEIKRTFNSPTEFGSICLDIEDITIEREHIAR